MEHMIECEMQIIFNKDKVVLVFTGEGIKTFQVKDDGQLRHKHTKLVNAINDVIRQYIKDNQ